MRHSQALLAGDRIQLCFNVGKAVPPSRRRRATSSAHEHRLQPPSTTNSRRLLIYLFCQVNFHPDQFPDLTCHVAIPGVVSLQRRSCPFASGACLGLVDMLLWWPQAFAEETISERAHRSQDVAVIYFPVLTIVILVKFYFSTMIHGWKIISVNVWHVN